MIYRSDAKPFWEVGKEKKKKVKVEKDFNKIKIKNVNGMIRDVAFFGDGCDGNGNRRVGIGLL